MACLPLWGSLAVNKTKKRGLPEGFLLRFVCGCGPLGPDLDLCTLRQTITLILPRELKLKLDLKLEHESNFKRAIPRIIHLFEGHGRGQLVYLAQLVVPLL